MNEKIKWIITGNSINVYLKGECYIIPKTNAVSDKLISALKSNDIKEIQALVSVGKRIEDASEGKFLVKDGKIFVNDKEAPEALGKKILSFAEKGLPFEPLVKFANKLQKNPSQRAIDELFLFLERNNHPITESGCFIAYKKVKEDFKDVYSGKIDNSPGLVVEMPREQVNSNTNITCSTGLHASSWNYQNNFYVGGRTLELEIDPVDVVSIPSDYNFEKMRVCKYKVIREVTNTHQEDEDLRMIAEHLKK